MFAGVLSSTLDRYVVSFLPNIGVGVHVLGGSLGGGAEEGYNFTLDSDMFWKVAFVLTEVRKGKTEELRRKGETGNLKMTFIT